MEKYIVSDCISVLEALKRLNELGKDVLTLFVVDADVVVDVGADG